MKETKRKSFSFFRSYYDVYNELSNEDKVAFMDALFDRQFLGIKPTDLTGMAKFAYISQTNSIDSQVKGYEDKTKTRLDGSIYCKTGIPPINTNTKTPTVGVKTTPLHGGLDTPRQQEEEEGKGKGEHTLKSVGEDSKNEYKETTFLNNWETCRKEYLKKPTHIKNLNFHEKESFKRVKISYTKQEINDAMQCLFSQERIPVDSMILRPSHFLEKFDIYYSGQGNTKIYGTNKKTGS